MAIQKPQKFKKYTCKEVPFLNSSITAHSSTPS